IWSMLFKTGLINVDFATLRQAFQQRGAKTLFGLGEGAGENAVADAIASLKLCPLLHTPEFSRKADRLLINITGGTDLTLPKVNELMTAITEQFGKESHVIMGAVIDESLQSRVEVCVLGTSDLGSRGLPPRRLASAVGAARNRLRTETAPRAEKKPFGSSITLERLAAGETPEQSVTHAKPVAQEEFGFDRDVESRGHFDKTDRNLFEGQDLDVPTYLRKGIKLAL